MFTSAREKLSIDQARTEFEFVPGLTYLNAASMGPLPDRTRVALAGYYETTSRDPSKQDGILWEAERGIAQLGAELWNVPSERVSFGSNTGAGLLLAANGLQLESGDEILLAEEEFPGTVYPWRAQFAKGVKLRFAEKIDGQLTAESYARAITPRTKIVVATFVRFHNGQKMPLTEIGELARQAGAYYIVDGMQGVGAEPIDLSQLPVDIFTAGGQKWLLSPPGSGLFYVSPRMREAVGEALASWQSVQWDSYVDMTHYDKPLAATGRRFLVGTPGIGNMVGLKTSLDMLLSIGISQIQAHTHGLLDALTHGLGTMPDMEIVSPLDEPSRSSILTFRSKSGAPIFEKLVSAGIDCSNREGGVRVSPHLYNTVADIDRLLNVIQ